MVGARLLVAGESGGRELGQLVRGRWVGVGGVDEEGGDDLAPFLGRASDDGGLVDAGVRSSTSSTSRG